MDRGRSFLYSVMPGSHASASHASRGRSSGTTVPPNSEGGSMNKLMGLTAKIPMATRSLLDNDTFSCVRNAIERWRSALIALI